MWVLDPTTLIGGEFAMIRQTDKEREERLAAKTLDRALINELQEGFNCSPFESRAILELVSDARQSLRWTSTRADGRDGNLNERTARQSAQGLPIQTHRCDRTRTC